eukprot:2012725-Alexandrium_andersonii.AAC.1
MGGDVTHTPPTALETVTEASGATPASAAATRTSRGSSKRSHAGEGRRRSMRSGPSVTRNVPPAAEASTKRPPAATCPDHSPTGLPTSTQAGVRGARPPPIV